MFPWGNGVCELAMADTALLCSVCFMSSWTPWRVERTYLVKRGYDPPSEHQDHTNSGASYVEPC